ncbi:MAG: hypothetical protein KDA91_17585 [Planctomycetaceae bacterium]|nr:hypothetical protein [Planctomycetaceae bacterium]
MVLTSLPRSGASCPTPEGVDIEDAIQTQVATISNVSNGLSGRTWNMECFPPEIRHLLYGIPHERWLPIPASGTQAVTIGMI